MPSAWHAPGWRIEKTGTMTEGGIQAMSITKLKTIAAAISMVASLASWAVAQAPDEKRAPVAAKAPPAAKLDLTPESFTKLHALIRPHENEWRHLKVEWLTDVVAARKKAAAEDKP